MNCPICFGAPEGCSCDPIGTMDAINAELYADYPPYDGETSLGVDYDDSGIEVDYSPYDGAYDYDW